MDLSNLLYKLKIQESVFRSTIKEGTYKISEIPVILTQCARTQGNITTQNEIAIFNSLVNGFFYLDSHTNTYASEYKKILVDLCKIYYDENIIKFFEIKIDYGNMFSVSKYLSDASNDMAFTKDLRVITYQNYILNLFHKELRNTSNTYGYCIVRDDIDEFSILASCSSFHILHNTLDEIMKNIQNFAEVTGLSSIPHSKKGKTGGIFIKANIYELINNNKTHKIEYKWDKFYNSTEDSPVTVEALRKNFDIKILSVRSDLTANSNTKKWNPIYKFSYGDYYLLPELLNPNIIRIRLIQYYLNNQKVTNFDYLVKVYKSLHSKDSPFELIQDSVSYSKDLEIYQQILENQKLSILHITISWLNWAGVVNYYNEDGVGLVNQWIQKNIIEHLYNDRIIFDNSRFYNDSGNLVILQFSPLMNKEGAHEYLHTLLTDMEHYINQVPCKYIIKDVMDEVIFGNIIDPRNENNRGIKLKFTIRNYELLKSQKFEFPVTKISYNKEFNHLMYE